MAYHSPEAFAAEIQRLAEAAGPRAELRTIGRTVEGRAIDAVTVAGPDRRPERSRPQAVVLAGMHGVEVIGTELALALLVALVEASEGGDAALLLARADVTVIPCLNVDGRTRSMESLNRRGLLVRAPRRNANGVDLNRNWPAPDGVREHWLPISGTRRRWLPWYSGPAPLSEPEAAAAARFMDELRPFALLNLHSTGMIITHPWSARPEPPADQQGFDAMIEAFQAAQKHHRYRAKQSRAWYPIVGSSNDWFYDHVGALPLTIETSPPAAAVRERARRGRWMFWYANPSNPRHWIENDLGGCLAALLAALRYRFPT